MQVYEGEVEPWLMSDYCTDTVPVLLRRSTFCRAFAADAKDFRAYNSWVRFILRIHIIMRLKGFGRSCSVLIIVSVVPITVFCSPHGLSTSSSTLMAFLHPT